MWLNGVITKENIAVFCRLDTENTSYDNVFTEPAIVKANANDRIGTADRQELAEVKIGLQMDTMPSDQLEQLRTGKHENKRIEVIAEVRDLRSLGLIDAKGACLLSTGTRLDRIEDRAGTTLRKYDDPQLFIVGYEYDGWGYPTGPNICIFTLEPRRKGMR